MSEQITRETREQIIRETQQFLRDFISGKTEIPLQDLLNQNQQVASVLAEGLLNGRTNVAARELTAQIDGNHPVRKDVVNAIRAIRGPITQESLTEALRTPVLNGLSGVDRNGNGALSIKEFIKEFQELGGSQPVNVPEGQRVSPLQTPGGKPDVKFQHSV